MNSFLNKDGLIHFSNKIKTYINNKINKLDTDISTLDAKVDSDKAELKTQMVNGDNILINEINSLDTKVTNIDTKVDTKVEELQTEIDSISLNPIDGDVINLSNVQQYEFKNVSAGEIIQIENYGSDIIVDVFAESVNPTSFDYKTIKLNSSTTSQFEYDDRFIEVTTTGVKPKNNITLNYTKTTEIVDGITFDIYTSDVIPSELTYAIESIVTIGEN